METKHSSHFPLFTLVWDCGKNQPVAEGEGGRQGEKEEGKAAALNQIIPVRSGSLLHSREGLQVGSPTRRGLRAEALRPI